MLWRICNQGMNTVASLKSQGLPMLSTLALLQEHLALYRLNSYEYLFAKEERRVQKLTRPIVRRPRYGRN